MTKEELKDQAREAGLPVSGTKDELLERLEENDVGTVVDPATPGVTKFPDPSPEGTYPDEHDSYQSEG